MSHSWEPRTQSWAPTELFESSLPHPRIRFTRKRQSGVELHVDPGTSVHGWDGSTARPNEHPCIWWPARWPAHKVLYLIKYRVCSPEIQHQSYIKQAIVMGPCGSLNWESTKTTSQHVNYTLFPIQLALVDSTYSHKYCIRCDFISNVWKCLANGWSIWNLILMLCISVSHAVPVSYLWDFQVYIIRGREFITPASKSIQNWGFEWESSSAPFERAYG